MLPCCEQKVGSFPYSHIAPPANAPCASPHLANVSPPHPLPAFNRTVNKTQQKIVDDYLSMPRKAHMVRHETGEREKGYTPRGGMPNPYHCQAAGYPSMADWLSPRYAGAGMGGVPPPLPPISRRPTISRAAINKERAAENERARLVTDGQSNYSKTSATLKASQHRVFKQLPAEVCRERAVITAGRAFSWGPRERFGARPFAPSRELLLNQRPTVVHEVKGFSFMS